MRKCFPRFLTGNTSCIKKSSSWRMLQRGLVVVLLTLWALSRPPYWAVVCLQQSYRTHWICREATGWLKKTSREQIQNTYSLYVYHTAAFHVNLTLLRKRPKPTNTQLWDKMQEWLTITSVPANTNRFQFSWKCWNMEKAEPSKKAAL